MKGRAFCDKCEDWREVERIDIGKGGTVILHLSCRHKSFEYHLKTVGEEQ